MESNKPKSLEEWFLMNKKEDKKRKERKEDN